MLSTSPRLSVQVRESNREDYHRIAAAIRYLRQHQVNQPDLATVARHVHLSEHHFQRIFTQWAGISPKRFLRYLAVEYAKATIARTQSLLDLTANVGISSPGRLHDLFVTLEAMSPGEFKAGGRGLTIHYGLHDTPFGPASIATTPRGICHLSFLDSGDEGMALERLQQEWHRAEFACNLQRTGEIAARLFDPNAIASGQPLPLLVKGTNFQVQVWRALLHIPFGGMSTYQTVASAIGRPTAARAVGNAVGSNPVAFLIPCHRVLRESGELGGYRWGLERKAALLGWEASRRSRTDEEPS
jgi:AraC family transcriptional regulator of adaptative response/methylated-DNA-[protein]-cysteine methyltransferase